jgi:hypothetical protein
MMNQQAVLPRHHDQFPGIKGFNRRGLYRMKQFYETYAGNKKSGSTGDTMQLDKSFAYHVRQQKR